MMPPPSESIWLILSRSFSSASRLSSSISLRRRSTSSCLRSMFSSSVLFDWIVLKMDWLRPVFISEVNTNYILRVMGDKL